MSYSSDGKWLAVGTHDWINFIDLSGDEPAAKTIDFKINRGAVRSITFTPNGKYVVFGSDDHMVRVWSVADAKEVAVGKAHTGGVGAVAVSTDGKLVVSGSEDQTAIVWTIADDGKLTEAAVIPRDDKYHGHVRELAFSDKVNRVLVVNTAGSVRSVDLTGGGRSWSGPSR